MPNLEAQQRYSSYRAILVAIVSQNYFALVFMGGGGIAQVSRDTSRKIGVSHRTCLCETKYQAGGYRTILGEC